jgi:hypothetical protein
MIVAPGHDVLQVRDADHVVLVLADHRDPRETAAQGQRERLLDGLVASMNTMSVRGTMTSLTMVSPSSKTERTISRSPGSMPVLRSR